MSLADVVRTELDRLRGLKLTRDPKVIDRVRGPFVSCEGRERLSFCSNDYLGIGQDPRVAEAAARAAREHGWGAAASRALQGTHRLHVELEAAIARVKRAPAALLFPSGYAANLGLITTIASKDTVIASDALNHASLIDACRLSRARVEVYPHRDAAAALRLNASFILTDTVFSMDGDLAPLDALRGDNSSRDVCPPGEDKHPGKNCPAELVVDDVHGLGVFGPEGRGNTDVPIQTGNLAKAAGGAGGFVVGPPELIALLRSAARSWLFTTAPPPAACAASLEALRILEAEPERRERLWANIRKLGAESPIKTIVLGSNEAALAASARLWDLGFFVPAIRPPTVPEGTSRLRVTVTSMHEPAHVEALLDALKKL
ncbi:MAG TPA: 8-amino-7-oxononanoate synthase [Planctomycetota bacterium]